MKKLSLYFTSLFFLFTNISLSQDKPLLTYTSQGAINNPTSELFVIYDQMNYPGTNSITSQNYETSMDNYDSFAADDFALMDMTWHIESIDVLGTYFNGTGPANSVNVWIYNCNGSGGLPVDIVYSALNIVPSAGLANGSFSIPLPTTVVLNEGWYWLCVQANMNYNSGGQWGWTERTFQNFSESAWKNPGGALGTSCTPDWGYRITNCGIGSQPDNCFRFNGFITPVELNSFTAEVTGSKVELNWSTSTETNNSGFEVLRISKNTKDWETIGFVPGFGTTAETKSYSFTDGIVSAGTYKYRLKQIDLDGSFEYSNEIEVEVDFTPKKFLLSQNYPNPFNPGTVISYQVPAAGNVTLKIYDILGNEVAALLNEKKQPGFYEVEFGNAGSSRGLSLPSGIYIYQLKAGDFVDTKKMIILK